MMKIYYKNNHWAIYDAAEGTQNSEHFFEIFRFIFNIIAG